MKILIVLSVITFAAQAASVPFQQLTLFNYHHRFGIPNAEIIKNIEENLRPDSSRIIGGSHATPGQFPYFGGLAITLTTGQSSVCGCSLLTNTRAVTAAHCWWDGTFQALRLEVVYGSITLYSGGTRIPTNNVKTHENWNPRTGVDNDVAMITHNSVTHNNIIQPIALPSGAELTNTFVGSIGVIPGFGKTSDSQQQVPSNQVLYHTSVPIISNAECQSTYGSVITSGNICTSGAGTKGTCSGDSGGPLVAVNNGRNVLVGFTSFGAGLCENGLPSVYTRTSHFINWILNA